MNIALAATGISLTFWGHWFVAAAVVAYAANNFFAYRWDDQKKKYINIINIVIILLVVIRFLTEHWMPLGAQNSLFANFLFVGFMIAAVLGILSSFIYFYPQILRYALNNKWKFLSLPVFIFLFGMTAWTGIDRIFGFMPDAVNETSAWKSLAKTFPGIGKEFMPALDEGSFLLMPTTMPHSGIEENLEVIRMLDKKITTIPEVDNVVGKWGRVNSALDPAPTSMYENVINYKPEYVLNEKGYRVRFKIDKNGAFVLKDGTTYDPKDGFRVIDTKLLTEDDDGEYFRQWRDHIRTPDDIWSEIVKNSTIPGLTSAPKLQPIQTRLVMLQTGMRAPMGIKVFGPDLESIEKTGLQIETLLKDVEGVSRPSVFADRVVGKPYLEININREKIARYGLTIKDMQGYLSSTVGGMAMTTTVEGRERYPVRVRYAREYRDNPEDLKKILISTSTGAHIPLGQLASIEYTRGPQLIKSENTFLVGYVIFDKKPQYAEVDVVENAQKYLNEKIDDGTLVLPAGVNYKFTGNYENQIRATKRLMVVIPIALVIIFLILYFQFRSVVSASLIFSGILLAFSGGFIMLWLYGQPWFMDFSIGGVGMQDMFQVRTINLSVAVWVGFIALFGIATDDGVLISTYLKQLFEKHSPKTKEEVRAIVMEAGQKRVRPAIMTIATTLIALLPVLTSRGKGSDIMVPMAIPIFGGMTIAILTIFVVPILYSMWKEKGLKKIS
jgi:Cu(I)/Ag(I) efflux system membrane protein CusA/SilA